MSIWATNVSYAFGRHSVLHDVTVEFRPGASLLLGPNGAGKSTLLETLASLRRPQAGETSIAGVGGPGPSRAMLRRYRGALAWLPQTFAPYPGVNVREHVALAGWLKGMSRRDAWDRAGRALSDVDMAEKEKAAVKTLSGGQRRRLAIAGALVHDARVLLLDEPTAGLDLSQRRRFHDLVAELSDTRTIVVSSHDTEDALVRYDEVTVLASGTVRFTGTVDAFLINSDVHATTAERFQEAYEALVGVVE